jgi:hypothetical protein
LTATVPLDDRAAPDLAGELEERRRMRRWVFSTGLLALSVSLALGAQGALAGPTVPVSLEGVWKIAKPTSVLKPTSGPVPFTEEGRKHYEENKQLKARGAYDDYDIATSRCSNPGVPRLMLTPWRFKIWQRQGVLTFDYEWNRALRQIDTGGVPRDPDILGSGLVPSMTGDSVGHWEGKTLVAQTTNMSDRTLIDDLVPHSADAKITERLRLVDRNTLEDRITIEDPAYFTHPWSGTVTYKRQPAALFPEDICLDRLDAHQPTLPSS